jgi:hypothetical protein
MVRQGHLHRRVAGSDRQGDAQALAEEPEWPARAEAGEEGRPHIEPVGLVHQGLADPAGNGGAIQEDHRPPAAGQESGRRQAADPGAHHGHINVLAAHGRPRSRGPLATFTCSIISADR